MNVNGIELPPELVADLDNGGRKLTSDELNRLKRMLGHVECPMPRFYDRRGIELANRLWSSPGAEYYLGKASESPAPGDVDPQLTVIIGHAEPDSPIALDYRSPSPRVVYFGDIGNTSQWIEVAGDYASLVRALQNEAL